MGKGIHASRDEVVIDPADVLWLEGLLDEFYRRFAK
jgi:hypothetical protein